MKTITEKQLIKILTEILPNGWDKKSVQIRTCPYSNSESVKEVSAIDEVLGRKVWFYYWLNDENKFHLSMDGANSWDYLSSESEYYFGFGEYIEEKFVNLFKNYGLYPHPQNSYSFVLGDI